MRGKVINFIVQGLVELLVKNPLIGISIEQRMEYEREMNNLFHERINIFMEIITSSD